jgi:cell division protein FtsQ
MFRKASKKGIKPGAAPEKGRLLGKRLKRQQVQKRQPAEKQPKPGRRLALRLVGRLTVLVGVFVIVGVGLLTAWSLATSLPVFELADAKVIGTNHLSRFDVLRTAGVGSHTNLLALNVGRIERRLMRHPWVEQARVERLWPNKVRIVLQERQPELVALVDGRFYYLDHEFRSFALVGSESAPDLPVLTGLSLADMVKPDDEMVELLSLARGLWRDLPDEDKGPNGNLSEIHADRVHGLSLVWNDLSATVRLGFKKFPERLALLAKVRADLKERGELEKAVLIDLDAQRRVVVRLAGDAA